MKKPIKVLIAKPGLDGHETGALLITKALVEANMEVIYLGTRQTPETIVEAAIQEDADIIGLSILSGIHKETSIAILKLLKKKGAINKPLIIGGIIPYEDTIDLKKIGVQAIFRPGAKLQEIIKKIKTLVAICGSKEEMLSKDEKSTK